jgi:hypothetical protein
MAVAMTALFVALGGTGYAATQLPGTGDVQSAAKKHKKPATDTAPDTSLFNKLFAKSNDNAQDLAGLNAFLAVTSVPNAKHASSADSATTATNATNATKATNATNSTNATNAANLGGSPASAYQMVHSRGVALAGARVSSTGSVTGGIGGWFNTFGGMPTITHTASSGVYDITFPGLTIDLRQAVMLGTLDAGPGEIGIDTFGGGAGAVVETYNSAGTLTDSAFHVVIFGASNTTG